MLHLQEAAINDRLCLFPLDTLYQPSRKHPFVLCSLSLHLYVCLALPLLLSPLGDTVVLLCSAQYITHCIHFPVAWQQIYELYFFGWHKTFLKLCCNTFTESYKKRLRQKSAHLGRWTKIWGHLTIKLKERENNSKFATSTFLWKRFQDFGRSVRSVVIARVPCGSQSPLKHNFMDFMCTWSTQKRKKKRLIYNM